MAKKYKSAGQDGQLLNGPALTTLTSAIHHTLNSRAMSSNKRKASPSGARDVAVSHKKQRSAKSKHERDSSKKSGQSLLDEIRALGGDESDLALVNDVASEDEMWADETSRLVDNKLQADLVKLSTELGLADYAPSEASEEEVEAAQQGHLEDVKPRTPSISVYQAQAHDDSDDEEPQDASELPNLKGKDKARAGNMMFEPRADWHAAWLPKLPAPTTEEVGSFTPAITALEDHARFLLEEDATKYRTSVFAQTSHKFLATIMSSGTLSDKVSALTLAVQESPVHNIRALDSLLSMASKSSRAQAIGALGALVDLLGPGFGLPADRRLRAFRSQPGLAGTLQKIGLKTWSSGQTLPGKITEAHLIAWTFEDWLKGTYFKIVQLLEVWCSDEIEYSRMKALDLVYALLKEKPEQEANLLRLLVNKLGDRDRKISSRASYLLLQLENSHPGMKPVVVHTVEQTILLRPSQDHRAKYSAINTLNQTILSSKEPIVAQNLVRIYFELFATLLRRGDLGIEADSQDDPDDVSSTQNRKANGKSQGKRRISRPAKAGDQQNEAADKLASAILTGVNRAAPFVSAREAIMESHVDTLFKIAHSANFNTGIQALLLIQHLSQQRHMASDRFYRTLYESLLDPRLITSSKQALYLNLLLRALKNDVDVKRVKAFVKRMLQISSLHQPSFVCGLLYVVSQLRETFPDLATLMIEPEESIFDDVQDDTLQGRIYDGRKRDPEHCNANNTCLWEIVPVQAHFHPAVSFIANSVFNRQGKTQKPDMDSHSLIRFLDKFVYKNPKPTDTARGASIMQPLKATKDFGDIWLGTVRGGKGSTSVNSASFWKRKAHEVAAEDVFFHEYFQHASKESRLRRGDRVGGKDDDGDAQEDEIWKALVSNHPEVDGDLEDGSDVGFDDIDEADMASSDDEGAAALHLDDESLSEASEVDIESSDEDAAIEADEGDLIHVSVDDSGQEKGNEARQTTNKRSERRKLLKGLPIFASTEDYAEMLGEEESF